MKTRLILALCLGLALSACSNRTDAERALTAQGFTDIQTHGWSAFACADSDFYSTKFTATNPQGQRVSGVACSGWFFKNTTIRW